MDKNNKNSTRKRYAKGQTVRGGLATREQETSKRKVKRPKPPVQESRKVKRPKPPVQESRKVKRPKPPVKAKPTINKPTINKPVRDLSDPTGQTFLDPKNVPNMKVGNQEPRNNTPAVPVENRAAPTKPTGPVQIGGKGGKPLPQFDASKKQPPMSAKEDDPELFIGGVGGTDPAVDEDNYVEEEQEQEQEEEEQEEEDTTTEEEEGSAIERTTTAKEGDPVFDAARRERIRETGLQTEAAARGEVPEGAIIDPAVQVGIDPETGKPFEDQKQKVTEMDKATKVGYQRDSEGNLVLDENGDPIQIQAGQVASETVSTGTVKTAEVPQVQIGVDEEGNPIMGPVPAAEITQDELDIVALDADVTAAQGDIQEDKLAKAAQVDRVASIEGADVDIPEGALAERVVGKISDGAKATAVMNVGSSLSRITRAKKQLSRAGLSDEDIKTIGNDPEDLEDRLADFSEEQRGIIEGLPEEALVSTQINGLLEGMENGEIPVWARPAVAQVEQMLAKRGMSASTVGRDNLFNAIIQSAMPIAQSNAQAIQQSVSQQKNIEAQEAEANAARGQQTALTNAQNVFQMDMAQFSADQQTSLSNSKFMQTVALTEASNDQQAAIQDAVLMSQANLAEADFYQKAQIQNAQAFLSMNMANLNNRQQANVLKSQQNQQRLLSNQSAQNAAAQFNATSENQTNQFMTNLKAQTDQYNVSQQNNMEQFNATQENAAEARRAGREADVNKFNAQLFAQADQFNSQQDFARNNWNAQNAAAVEASNVQWRRQSNTINTAAQNQINMQNAQNAFNMSSQAQSFLWQELRDQADFDFRAGENQLNRNAQILSTAIANEGKAGQTYDDLLSNLVATLGGSFNSAYSSSSSYNYGRGGGGIGSGYVQP